MSMTYDERRQHLLLSVDHLIDVWNAWTNNPDVRYITKTFEDAVDEVIGGFADGTIPGELRALHGQVQILSEHWNEWNKRNQASGGKYPLPGNAFWNVLESIDAAKQALARPVRKTLETIAQLDALNPRPNDGQICRMYGFVDAGGNPEIWKLQEERANPGKHTGPGTGWKPPHEARREAEEAAKRSSYERLKRQRESKLDFLTKAAPEPIEQLLAEGVSGKQICKMKKIDEGTLAEYCQEHGLTLPAWNSPLATNIKGDTEADYDEPQDPPAGAESVTEIDAEGLTLEQEIIEYHKLGTMMAADIATAVSRPGNEISHTKVRKIIKRYQEDPAAFVTNDTAAI